MRAFVRLREMLASWRMYAFARQRPLADFDEDGDDFLTGSDFLYWQRQFGETPPDVAALNAAIDDALAASAIAVPGPASCVFVAAAELVA